MTPEMITECAQREALEVIKLLTSKYPDSQDGSGAIILQTMENILALLLISLEKQIKAKQLMRLISQGTLRKIKIIKENLEAQQEWTEQHEKDKQVAYQSFLDTA